ncbi:porphobilinogen deaminase [Cryphonectria parasitica EP155]|uniref:Porphobilinogen deaminase n=1 Tax=Cryphonectria parasitica (strain ATCC 38755 / EP155) TaxID=660469 RepID=A0A9P4YEM6_CRYP1|nr:porphobilinogen deaminase [Cryphonectria parasitica EP155]KAF3771060.1 porphobilinogen deaminase [Cryphonectria parasitica EP155]
MAAITAATTLPALPAGTTIRVGTRRSALALKQCEIVIGELQQAHPHIKFETVTVSVMGDRDKTTPLPNLGKGLWTSELEAMLTSDTPQLDMILHCLKDMPTALPAGCVIGCITKREDPRDVVVFKAGHEGKYKKLADLPEGAVIGTSSLRRAAQLRRRYPGLVFKDMRGNIDTRMKKCDDESLGFDATILAAAGLLRMNMGHRIGQFLDSESEGGGMLHAVGQGALAVEIREGDLTTLGLLKPISDTETMLACEAERSVMRTLEGGCSVPIGVETHWVPGEDGVGSNLRLRAVVVSLDGQDGAEVELQGDVADPEAADALGKKAASILVEKGASKILDVINSQRAETPGTASAASAAAAPAA